ncbi:hypothetical protein [Nostoc linckia]|nr:hypothetical protein [Nostoc linckia]
MFSFNTSHAGAEEKEKDKQFKIQNEEPSFCLSQCPMPNAQCPMPHPPFL